MSIYDELGVKRYINALATVTMFGGSLMPGEVLDAMREAAGSFVSIPELQKKAGDYIAKLTHNEAAMISNGAAAGMVLATAACIAGDDPDKRNALPYTDDMKNEIVLFEGKRVGYDFAIRQAGGKIVGYGGAEGTTANQLEAAITKNTAAIFIFQFEHQMDAQPSIEAQVAIGKRHGVPVIVDAAAQIPKKENLWRFTRDLGADAAIFSGGKGLRGPQSSGLVVGRRALIERMASFACPNGGIGRPLKVGKEEIVGLMAAVKRYMERDEAADLRTYEEWVRAAVDAFAGDQAVLVERDYPSEAGQPMPRAKLTPRPGALKINARGIDAALRACEPGVLVTSTDGSIFINPQTLNPGEIEIVIEKIQRVIEANR